MENETDPRKWFDNEQQELQKLQRRMARKSPQYPRPIWVATAVAIAIVILGAVIIHSWDTLTTLVSRRRFFP